MIFEFLIGAVLAITFGFYTAGLWISFKTGSHYASLPPLPPIYDEINYEQPD